MCQRVLLPHRETWSSCRNGLMQFSGLIRFVERSTVSGIRIGTATPHTSTTLGADVPESSFVEKALGFLLDTWLNVSEGYALVAANSLQGYRACFPALQC